MEVARRRGDFSRRERADDVERPRHRHDRHHLHAAAALLGRGVGAGQDVRRPGGDRDPERAPVQRDEGSAGAADGDGRDPQGHQRLAHRHPAGVRRDRHECRPAVRTQGRAAHGRGRRIAAAGAKLRRGRRVPRRGPDADRPRQPRRPRRASSVARCRIPTRMRPPQRPTRALIRRSWHSARSPRRRSCATARRSASSRCRPPTPGRCRTSRWRCSRRSPTRP